MSRSPILFRCDGTYDQGWEPFYQCMTLAQAIQRRRRGTYFHSRLDPANLALTIHRGGHEWLPAEHSVGCTDDLDATVRQARKIGASAIVVVAPGISVEYLRELNATGLVVVAVDTAAELDFPSRLVYNPYLGVDKSQYHHARGTQLLVGERFALIRGMIRRIRPLRAQEPPAPFRGLVALGDDDLQGRAGEIAQQLLEMPKVEKVAIVARAHHPRIAELKEMAEAESRLEVVSENGEVSTRLTRAHFAITSGDTWSLEYACLGLPQLMMPQNPRHIANARQLDEEGTGIFLGEADGVTPGALRTAVSELLSDPLERRGMTRTGRQLFDGRGTDRFVTAVEVLLHVATRSNMSDERIAA